MNDCGTFIVGLMIQLQASGGQGVECDGLRANAPYRPIGSGTIRNCGLVGKVCHCGSGLLGLLCSGFTQHR